MAIARPHPSASRPGGALWRAGLGAVVALVGLMGCGKGPSTLPPAYVPPVAPLQPQPSPGQPSTPGEPGQDVAAWRELVRQAMEATHSWKADARSDMRLPDGGSDFNLSRMRFRRPGWLRGEILQAKQANKKGTVVVFDGKREVRVKTYLFGLLAVRATLDVRDPRLLDPYKRSIADSSSDAMLNTFLDPKATLSYVGEGTVAGEPVAFIDVVGGHTYAGIAKDRYGISKRLNLPIFRDSYDPQNRVLFHCELRGMQVNVPMGATDFTTD